MPTFMNPMSTLMWMRSTCNKKRFFAVAQFCMCTFPTQLARRKTTRIAEILKFMSTTTTSTADTTTTTQQQATDPSVVTDKDFDMICKQLQKSKKKVVPPQKILRRCKWGYPQITFAYSSKQNGDFDKQMERQHVPGTLVWITCPRVRDLVSKIEITHLDQVRNVFGLIDEEGNASPAKHAEQGRKDLLQSHANYAEWLQNSHMLTDDEFYMWQTTRAKSKDANAVPHEVVRYGNGGSSNPLFIKCLHAHTSALLAGSKDLVGKETFRLLKKTELKDNPDIKEGVTDMEDLHVLDCPSNCIRCKSYEKN